MPDGTAAIRTKRSKLLAVKPEAVKLRKPKILVYGASGVGKTYFALDFPDVYMIDVEGGATQPEYVEKLRASGGLYLGPDDGASSFDVVMGQIKALATESHDRKTLVIDSATKLFANEIAREAERLSDAGKKNEFGADRKPAVNYMRHMVNWLVRLDMNVILICGEIAEWGKGANGEREQIGTIFDCWPRLEYELDLAVQVLKAGPRRIGRVRKTRIAAFPEASTFEFSYDTFARMYGIAVIREPSQPVNLITPEQRAEISHLLDIVKLEDGTVDKWLAAANVASWDEMESHRADKAIAYLRNRIAAIENV